MYLVSKCMSKRVADQSAIGQPMYYFTIFTIFANSFFGKIQLFQTKFQIFPSCAPEEGTAELQEYQDKIPSIEAGEGRSLGMQAAYQGCQIALYLVLFLNLLISNIKLEVYNAN